MTTTEEDSVTIRSFDHVAIPIQNIDAMLSHITGAAPFTILDFGCGPGRDLVALTRLGHRATAVRTPGPGRGL